jgi:hypothetical protein
MRYGFLAPLLLVATLNTTASQAQTSAPSPAILQQELITLENQV